MPENTPRRTTSRRSCQLKRTGSGQKADSKAIPEDTRERREFDTVIELVHKIKTLISGMDALA